MARAWLNKPLGNSVGETLWNKKSLPLGLAPANGGGEGCRGWQEQGQGQKIASLSLVVFL